MALKAVRVAEVPHLDEVPEGVDAALQAASPACLAVPHGSKRWRSGLVVVGHRGRGMNAVASGDARMRGAVRENSLRSFNQAGRFPIDFVEFDVQVTKDDYAIVFHDNFILTEEDGKISEKRVTDLYLEEFLSYGLQKEFGKVGKSLLRKTKDGRVVNWNVEEDDSLCTLQEAFEKVDSQLGFNIEIKLDDYALYQEEELSHGLQVILQVVLQYANERPIIFSTFQPDAAQLMRKLQSIYPVYFLTEGGSEIYDDDVRRNSLDEAIKLCLASGLQGIVSDASGVFRNPSAISRIKESNLRILTYGQLNNVPEAVYMQHLMGIDGVIVDLVEEITEAVSDLIGPSMNGNESLSISLGEGLEAEREVKELERPMFTQRELSFLLKLIPELVQH